MNIIEATKKALEENKAITNPESREFHTAFVPTNSAGLGILIVPTKPSFTKSEDGGYKEKWPITGIMWNPRAVDLVRDDWELF